MVATRAVLGSAVDRIEVSAYEIPTDAPESDGTLVWDSTTLVVVEVEAAGEVGLGFTYAPVAAARLVADVLAPALRGLDVSAVGSVWEQLGALLRNAGRPGLSFTALSAVDVALWDLKARVLELPLTDVLDRKRDEVPVYGSGGFTSYGDDRLEEQMGGWVERGIRRVKMKIGREHERDGERLGVARRAIGADAELYVDANGAFDRKVALGWAERLPDWGVSWFEEPVSSDDLDGLRLLRDRAPGSIDIAAGEYGYVSADFRGLLVGGCVDVLQIDATRCGGITGFCRAAALADAFEIPVSAHTAPQLHAHVCCSVPRVRHLEYFHDHVRIENLLFDGTLEPVEGALGPDRSRPGHGLELRRAEAEEYLVLAEER